MTRIKICGITNQADAEKALEYGASALGFIHVPQTPRYVGSWEGARDVPLRLPPFVARTAVCRDLSDIGDELSERYDVLQFYRFQPEMRGLPLRLRLMQVFQVQNANSLLEIQNALEVFTPSALMLDTYHKEQLGGSGHTFDWEVALEVKAHFSLPLVLAGGLNPDNVYDAVCKVRPYAVDVSSGVEQKPGRKDYGKLRAFCEAVANANKIEEQSRQ